MESRIKRKRDLKMRFNLLDFIICPKCKEKLYCIPFKIKKIPPNFNHLCEKWCGAKLIQIEKNEKEKLPFLSFINDILEFKSPLEINLEDCRLCHQFDVIEGILICLRCNIFYPIKKSIPEILPDELRNLGEDKKFLIKNKDKINFNFDVLLKSIYSSARAFLNDKKNEYKFKKAEMELTKRKDLPEGFLNPGYVMPFESLQPRRTIERILRFITSMFYLDLKHNDLILDLGVGYAWTSEWLMKLGYRVIAIDINRDYMEIGLKRTKNKLPPLIVSDIENLPLRKQVFHGALFFDTFHHLANRKKCLQDLSEILVPGGRLIMAEPGPRHEFQPISIQVMEKYGILEKGISKKDIKKMIKNTSFKSVKKFPYSISDIEIILLEKKGNRIFDSRGPDFLCAQIKSEQEKLEINKGNPFTIRLFIKNIGNTIWLKETLDGIGKVRIGFQLKNMGRALVDENFFRYSIPKNILPGEKFKIEVKLPPVKHCGKYILEIDLVSEGIMWFKDCYYNPYQISLEVK